MEKDKIAARKAYAKLTKKQKISHFWEYYRWHAIITIGVILMAGSFIYSCATRVHPDLTIFYLSHPRNFVEIENIHGLSEHFSEFIEDANNDGRTIASIQESIFTPPDADNPATMTEMTMAIVQRLDAQIVAGDAMLFIGDETLFEWFYWRYGGLDDDAGLITAFAPIINREFFEILQIDENVLFLVGIRDLRSNEMRGRNAEQKAIEHANAVAIFELLTE